MDVGCGIGGTTRHLAKSWGCNVTGITISGRQVEIAKELSAKEVGSSPKGINETETFKLGSGSVSFLELDAEKMGNHFAFVSEPVSFDCVWIVEAMSHLPDKKLFFRNAEMLLRTGGKLVIADWFKAEDLTEKQLNDDIKPIEGWSDRAIGLCKN